MDNLKACPFCGKQPENYLAICRAIAGDYIYAKIRCMSCDIEISEYVDNYSSFVKIDEMEEKVVKRWNSRTNCPECIKEE